MSKRKTFQEIQDIVMQVKFPDRDFFLGWMGMGAYVQVRYTEPDVDTGMMGVQHARKWYISPYATETEIVETCYAAIRRSFEHVIGEHFTYQGRRIYSPHFEVSARLELCDQKRFDKREEEPKA